MRQREIDEQQQRDAWFTRRRSVSGSSAIKRLTIQYSERFDSRYIRIAQGLAAPLEFAVEVLSSRGWYMAHRVEISGTFVFIHGTVVGESTREELHLFKAARQVKALNRGRSKNDSASVDEAALGLPAGVLITSWPFRSTLQSSMEICHISFRQDALSFQECLECINSAQATAATKEGGGAGAPELDSETVVHYQQQFNSIDARRSGLVAVSILLSGERGEVAKAEEVETPANALSAVRHPMYRVTYPEELPVRE